MKKFKVNGYAKFEARLTDIIVEAENEADAIEMAFYEVELEEHFRHIDNCIEVKE